MDCRLSMRARTRPARISFTNNAPMIRISSPARFDAKMTRAIGDFSQLFGFRAETSGRPLGLLEEEYATTHQPLGETPSGLLVSIADAVKRFDGVKHIIQFAEFLPQAFDMAINGAVVHIDLIIIRRIHQLVAAFHIARTGRERL